MVRTRRSGGRPNIVAIGGRVRLEVFVVVVEGALMTRWFAMSFRCDLTWWWICRTTLILGASLERWCKLVRGVQSGPASMVSRG